MRLNIQLALALASICAGCGYDTGNDYAQHGYVPEYPQPSAPYGYAPGYAPYGYPSYSPYGYAPQYYQQAPSLGLGFGYFGGGGRRDHERDEWREHQEFGREHRGGLHQPPAALNLPPPAAHAPPPAFHPAAPAVAPSVPPAAANAAALNRLGFRANPHP